MGLLALGAGGSSRAAQEQGLVLHYPCDAFDGSTLPDAAGGAHTANRRGAPDGVTWVADDERGGALAFNGQGFLDAGPAPYVEGQPALSFGAWIKPAAPHLGAIFGKCQSEDVVILLNVGTPNNLHGATESVGSGLCATNDGRLRSGVWQHVMGVYDGTSFRLYLDGVLVAISRRETPAVSRANRLPLCIGESAPGRGWRYRGLMDDLRIYQRALAPAEVAALVAATAPPHGPPAQPPTLGPCYLVRAEGLVERAMSPTGRTERVLSSDESRRLVEQTGTAAAAAPAVCRIGFSNAEDGDRDVTVFMTGETLFAWVEDVDLTAAGTNATVHLFLSQQGAIADDARSKLTALARGTNGVFAGSAALADFRPGTILASVIGSAGDPEPLLRRTARIELLESR